MSDAPDPPPLTTAIDGDALNREISVVRDDADEPRGEEFDDANEPVRGARQDGVTRRGVSARECTKCVDRVWVPVQQSIWQSDTTLAALIGAKTEG